LDNEVVYPINPVCETEPNTEIITKFIVEHIEPLLEEQVAACLSKTQYLFVPSGIDRTTVTNIIPLDKNMVEGFGGSKTTGSYISQFTHKEYVKIIRLTRQEYDLEFWKQPEVVKELEQTLKARLKANGEKVAETVTNLAGRLWGWRSMYDVEILPPGYTGVEFHFFKNNIHFYAEIA
jgi:hypothetical protein